MRFTTLAAASVFAVYANAQTASPTVSLTPAQSSIAACLDECTDGDVGCESRCITVPAPNEDQANDTTECVANCDQGDGSPADTDAYAACINECIATNFYATSAGTPNPTGAPGSGSGSDDGADDNADNTTDESGPTPTDSGDGASETGADDNNDDSTDDSEPTPTESGDGASETGAEGTEETEDPDSGASSLVGSSVALFGIVAAVLAL